VLTADLLPTAKPKSYKMGATTGKAAAASGSAKLALTSHQLEMLTAMFGSMESWEGKVRYISLAGSQHIPSTPFLWRTAVTTTEMEFPQ
jgi:hypothetical protein